MSALLYYQTVCYSKMNSNMLHRRGLQAQPSIAVNHDSSSILDVHAVATAPVVPPEPSGRDVNTDDANTTLAHVTNLERSDKWACRFGPVMCGVTFSVDVSAAVVKKHLEAFHGINTCSAPTTIKCLWLENGGPGCSADIQVRGLAKHVAQVHLHTGAERCPYCRKWLSRGNSMRRHMSQRCRARPCTEQIHDEHL